MTVVLSDGTNRQSLKEN